LTWIRGRENAQPWLALAVSPAFFAAALLAKETSLVVPAAIVLWELTAPDRPHLRQLAAALRGHLAVAVIAIAAAVASPTYRLLVATSFDLVLDPYSPSADRALQKRLKEQQKQAAAAAAQAAAGSTPQSSGG